MSTFITMQLNATDVAGDWATRDAGTARTGTGTFGPRERTAEMRRSDEVAIHLFDLRGAVEAMRSDVHGDTLADSRTDARTVGWGTPALYCGMRFALGQA